MPIRNRELSQFGSFVYIEDSNRSIGIATTATPYVGIGTTNAQEKLHIVGNLRVDGGLQFLGNINLDSGDINTTGTITASAFFDTSDNQLVAFDSWSQEGLDIYRLNGNVGIGTAFATEKLDVRGNVSASRFISTATVGTAPLQVSSTTEVTNLNASLLRGGTPGANINSFDIVTRGGTQTLTNKTLTLPRITGLGVTFNGSTSGTTTLLPSANPSNNSVTLPTTNGTLISTGDTGVVTGNMITDLSITNSDVSLTAGITYGKLSLTNSITNNDIATSAGISISKLSASTISGISLGNNLNNLTAGSFITYNSGTTYNGSTARTISVAATTANTGNTIVARDASGDFTAGTITVTNLTASQTVQATDLNVNLITSTNGNFSGIVTATDLNVNLITSTNGNFSGIVTATDLNVNLITSTNGNFSGIVTATDFNSTSDINLKENIKTIENSLNTLTQLRGVSFDWKETGKGSYGVIAQELEEILPELVKNGEVKSVNYNGLIGVLIEAVKELKKEIEELKKTK
jgi:hypothetical protein